MSTVANKPNSARPIELPFENGDRFTQTEFHALYLAAPDKLKAELIQGEVFVASPVRYRHADFESQITTLLGYYRFATPGLSTASNATILLNDENELQPDELLRIDENHGGLSRINANGYLVGSPELIIEISYSSRAIDMHRKKDVYTQQAIPEYLVVNIQDNRFHWFDLQQNIELPLPDDGILRSRVFPGLWIDSSAFFSQDGAKLLATLQQGLASREHAEFVAQLCRFQKPA